VGAKLIPQKVETLRGLVESKDEAAGDTLWRVMETNTLTVIYVLVYNQGALIRKIYRVESGLAITYVRRVNYRNIMGLTLVGFLLLTGCESTNLQREQASQRTDISRLREKIEVLQSDVDSVQNENEGLRSEVSQLKKDLSTSQTTNTQYQKDIERLDTLLKKLDTARDQDRKIIVEEVSQEISRLSKKLSNASTTGKIQTAAQSVERGVEHVVAKGETLYAIARAYGVTVKVIQDANQLTSNSLKTGQKLFIPQK